MSKTTDRIKRRWDSYRAKVAELEAENAKLRKQVEELKEDNDALQSAILESEASE